MSELKTVHAFDVYEAYTKTGDDDAAQVYLKSEADKVIADLEESHKMEVEQLLMEIAELEEERRWRNVDDKFPTADEGYILVLWEDGLPDIGYIGAEEDVIETVRDRGEGHSVDWWMPLPSAPKEEK